MRLRLALTLLLMAVLATACQNAAGPPGGSGNSAPSASLTAEPTHGSAPLTVHFDGSASSDPDGTIAAYSWAFGDGSTASGPVADHVYDTPGGYTARLTVTDNQGASAQAQRAVAVADESGNVPPTASFTATPEEGEAPLTVAFDATASSDPDGSVTSYAWAFGDGGLGTGATPSHTYAEGGTFEATLTVTDDGGLETSLARTITVTGGDGGSGDDAETAKMAGAAFGSAEDTPRMPDVYTEDAVDVVLMATSLVGSEALVGTGTVTQTGADSWAYDPAPADRLKLDLLDGRSFEMVVSTLNGDFTKDGARFLNNAHQADLTITSNVAAQDLDVRLTSELSGGDRRRSAVGQATDELGIRWTFDVATTGIHTFDTDAPEHVVEDTVTGTIEAPAAGIVGTIDKYYRYKMLNFVENIRHEVDYAWTQGGSSYRLQLVVFVAFRESKPVDVDQWEIGGALTRDGAQIGVVQASDDPTGLSIWLQIGAERSDLFFFSYL